VLPRARFGAHTWPSEAFTPRLPRKLATWGSSRPITEITERLKVSIADRYVIERELGQGGIDSCM